MPKVIIHTPTRVIRRITTDENPSISSDESFVEVDFTDIGGGFWRLDDLNNKVLALEKDIDASGIDDTREAVRRKELKLSLYALIDDISTNGPTQDKLKQYFILLRKLR